MVNAPGQTSSLENEDVLQLPSVVEDVSEFVDQHRQGMNVRLLVAGGMRQAERDLEYLDQLGIRDCETAKVGNTWQIIAPEKR